MLRTALVGSAKAVSDALSALDRWDRTGLSVRGAVLVGPGEVDVPILARVPLWQSLDFSGLDVRALVLASPPEDGATGRAILERAAAARARVYLIENGAPRRMRLDDLLGRPLGAVDSERMRTLIEGKRVLITGGGGSIGSELARRVATLSPARLTLLDASEFNLYRIGLDLENAALALADIRDAAAMRRWFDAEKPDLVFHAAALKQVPLAERFPCESVLTNVGGLRNVAEAAHRVGAELIFVSTDKAVDPSGVMGASKRLGEIYCQALDRGGGRRAIPVRLGNVLGSTGSVLPIFAAQLASGGPLTVTDPEVTRFFLTIPQAANALLQAAAVGLGQPEQRGGAFVIEMGEALSVVELAREVIRLEGLQPEEDMPIVFTGLRPGEKLHEALVASDEWVETDVAPGVISAFSAPRSVLDLHDAMDRLMLLARQGADTEVRRNLFAAVAPIQVESEERAVAS